MMILSRFMLSIALVLVPFLGAYLANNENNGNHLVAKSLGSSFPSEKNTPTSYFGSSCSIYKWKTINKGFILSPGYPKSYQKNEKCAYLIIAPPGQVVSLKSSIAFVIHSSNGNLTIRDGSSVRSPLLRILDGEVRSLSATVSTGRSMFIQLNS
jgi:hypothetical protein